MSTEQVLGYLAAAIIGIALGLVGGGGSILTVPVLVYLFGIEPTLATAYSLFIVGTTSLVGGLRNAAQGLVDWRTTLVFAIPSFIAVYFTRRYLLPALPEVWLTLPGITLTKNMGIMIIFALVMLGAGVSMIRKGPKEQHPFAFNYAFILLEGLVVGGITGLVGAGGGFLIIPALVLFANVPMKMAIGTSLMIIAAKSLIGFLGDWGAGQPIDFAFLVVFSLIAVAGIFTGQTLSQWVSSEKLKKGFGWFVLAMALFILLSETVF
jgi:hypothetical protein